MEKKRFAEMSEDELKKVREARLSTKTNISTQRAYDALRDFYNDQKDTIFTNDVEKISDVSNLSQMKLNRLLQFFWSSYRNKDGSLPKLTTLRTIKFGLKRKFNSDKIDIDGPTFSESNAQYLSQSAVLKREGKAEIIHKLTINEKYG